LFEKGEKGSGASIHDNTSVSANSRTTSSTKTIDASRGWRDRCLAWEKLSCPYGQKTRLTFSSFQPDPSKQISKQVFSSETSVSPSPE
jgi:hypothetical protein